MIKWTYITNNDNTARYTLGKLGKRVLFFIGINPSTARPDDLDRTVTRVENFALDNGFDGWVMLNVYAQRATNPKDMDKTPNLQLHKENIEQIKNLIKKIPEYQICAGWGTEIERRKYLKDLLKDIIETIGHDKNWIHLNQLTKYNHPRHPLYLPSNSEFSSFDTKAYLKTLFD